MKSAKRGGWWELVAVIGISIGLLLALYIGAYFANVTDGGKWLENGAAITCFTPGYRVCEAASRKLFAPMFAIDRVLRPGKWTEPTP